MSFNIDIETSGWWSPLEQLDLSTATEQFPRAIDHFQEAKHFLRLVVDLEPKISRLPIANWYASAHMTAVISIREAVKDDAANRHAIRFEKLPIAQEFFLKPNDPDPALRDPMGVNRAYSEYRNLRVHFGRPALSLDRRILVQDLADLNEVRSRWFFMPLEGPDLRKLKHPLLTPQQRKQFNQFAKHKAFVELAAHHLYLVGRALQGSAHLAQPTAGPHHAGPLHGL